MTSPGDDQPAVVFERDLRRESGVELALGAVFGRFEEEVLYAVRNNYF